MVPVAGVEPARCRHRWILSPLRLPIPSYRHVMIFDENLQKRSMEIGGPFRRPIGNSEKTKCEKVKENQGFASSRAGDDESDFEFYNPFGIFRRGVEWSGMIRLLERP